MNLLTIKKPKNEKISYENGNYLMPACELDDQGDFSITKVTQQTGFSYHVSFEPVIENKPIDAPDQYYEALIEERDGRYIMKSYKKTIVEKDSQEENNQEDTEIPMEDLETSVLMKNKHKKCKKGTVPNHISHS